MRIRNLAPAVFVCVAAILLGAAARAATPTEEIASPFDPRIGWFYECLAIKNHALESGTPITVLIFDPGRTEFVAYGTYTHRVTGRIVGKTRSGERCRVLDASHGGTNDSPDMSFYEVSLDGVQNPEFIDGVVIVGLDTKADVIDLNGDGAQDSFTLCHTGEGFLFEMWAGDARTSDRLWSGTLHFNIQNNPGNCETGPIFVPVLGPYDLQVGYVDECLVIKNSELEPGTPVTIMTFDDEDRFLTDRVLDLRLTGTIVGKTASDVNCPPLYDTRGGGNKDDGVSFYALALDDGPLMNPEETVFGIGVLGRPAEDADPIDLDADGFPDSFTACKYYEGFEYVVWSGAPYEGEPVWSSYYYLGYETEEIECPVVPPDTGPDVSGPPRNWMPVFRIGWLHGCFGISHDRLEPGTPVGIMVFDGENDRGEAVFRKRLAAKILNKTESGENCPALEETIREWNLQRGFGYYTLALENGESLPPEALGIGVVGPEPDETPFDLDGNGQADGFSLCYDKRDSHTFVVWVGKPHLRGEIQSNDALVDEVFWTGHVSLSRRLPGVPDCLWEF